MKGSRVLLVALALVDAAVVGCGSSTGCPNGYEVVLGMCVPEGSVRPDAAMDGDAGLLADDAWAMSGDDAAMDDTSMELADAGVPEAMPDAAVPSDTGCPYPLLFADVDGDGFGDHSAPLGECAESRAGYVLDATDCSDACASCHPGGTETCNGADDDCDAMIDDGVMSSFYVDADGDGFGTGSAVSACTAPAGHSAMAGDCNDACASCVPGGTETCNGADDDCDGSVDDGVLLSFYVDADGDGFGTGSAVSACSAPAGHSATAGDCNDGCASCRPGGTETCNGADDDCDAMVDDGVTTTFYLDADGDTYGRSDRTTQACTQPAGHAARGGDCDDASSTASPGATEICDGRDNDCDGGNDEGLSRITFRVDCDRDGYTPSAGETVESCALPTTTPVSCPSGAWSTVTPGVDCHDGLADVFPGQTRSFSSRMASAPTTGLFYDYDCDGVERKSEPNLVDCDRYVYGWRTTVPACGTAAIFDGCGFGTVYRAQACR